MHVALLALTFQLGLAAQPVRHRRAARCRARRRFDARSARRASRRRRRSSARGATASPRAAARSGGATCSWAGTAGGTTRRRPNLPPRRADHPPPRRPRRHARRARRAPSRRRLDRRHARPLPHRREDRRGRGFRRARVRAPRRGGVCALVGYADHKLGRSAAAESAFVGAFAAMPDSARLPLARHRGAAAVAARGTTTSQLSCAARRPVEERYWLLSRPRLGGAANDWRTEFYVRRVLATLYRAGDVDAPGRVGSRQRGAAASLRLADRVAVESQTRYGSMMDVSVTEYHPVPSYNFAPVEALYDTSATAQNDGWELEASMPEARYSPRLVEERRARRHAGRALPPWRFRPRRRGARGLARLARRRRRRGARRRPPRRHDANASGQRARRARRR